MSSSAAAIAANSAINTLDSNLNSSARKRHPLVAEKKSIGEAVAGVDGRDKPAEIFRPRDDFIATPKMSPKRKKSASRPEKPRWKTILSILIKNGLLLAVLISLGRTIWKSYDLNNVASPLFTAPALVDQISVVKETTKMLHDRLQAAERKIEREINAAKRELTGEINERSLPIESKFMELKARSDALEASLNKFMDSNFLTKADLQIIFDDIKKTENTGIKAPHLTLDEVRTCAREIVMKEIEKHASDGIGRVDFALASGGGRVVRHSEAFNYGKSSWFQMGRGRNVHPNAHKMLQPSFGEPGQCFALRGSSGFVEIKLRTGIIPNSVTLEHVAKSVGYDRSSAPKDCRISAWYEDPAEDPSSRTEKMMTLVELTYDLEKVNAQTFSISSSVGVVNMIRLDFSSNHGNPLHTCLYRLRIHGSEPDPMNMVMGS